MPRVMGVREILRGVDGLAHGVRQAPRVYFELQKARRRSCTCSRACSKILLDIDKAITIIRETEEEAEVVPNLMIGFGIDQMQAEYVAEIKLRNINQEYILKRAAGDDSRWSDEIADLEDTLESPQRVQQDHHRRSWSRSTKKYGAAAPDRAWSTTTRSPRTRRRSDGRGLSRVRVFLSREGYFKKITPQSLRMSGEQKFKEGDGLVAAVEATQPRGAAGLHRPAARCYKTRLSDFEDAKAIAAGRLPARQAGHGRGRERRAAVMPAPATTRASCCSSLKTARPRGSTLSAYDTKTNRRKLTGAYSDKSPLVGDPPAARRSWRWRVTPRRAARRSSPQRPARAQDHPLDPGRRTS